MATISLRLNDEDAKLVQEYVAANDLNLSSFVRELILDKIEDDLALDEERIINARTRAANEASYDHTEVWKKLGV
ncbi:MAG: ribbon-helix-helix protein, CopG family [Firmicutes bacterium]|nr:ribbon-helix-helix protein, CopG family [Bacillota bacterium]